MKRLIPPGLMLLAYAAVSYVNAREFDRARTTMLSVIEEAKTHLARAE